MRKANEVSDGAIANLDAEEGQLVQWTTKAPEQRVMSNEEEKTTRREEIDLQFRKDGAEERLAWTYRHCILHLRSQGPIERSLHFPPWKSKQKWGKG
jgi:hypothetical protein